MWNGKYVVLVALCIGLVRCRKPYEPPAIKASNHFLAIDGVINTGQNSSSTFKLSRSRNLQDSVTDLPELNAQVQIVSAGGASYPLVDTGGDGNYICPVLSLDPTQSYQVSVTTVDGNKYLSDLVVAKTSPPIDSLHWEVVFDPVVQTNVLNIYVNTHDETNNTRYYRWDYLETWQHTSIFQTYYGLRNGLIYAIDPSESTYTCWTTAHSTNILLGTSITLSADVISRQLVASFQQNDTKLDIDYSILLRQYPLDFNAYTYWLTVQKNSQSLGGLFDLQPAQINGNIHGITNPKDPVLGYVSASSVQELRLFIDNTTLRDQGYPWKSNPLINCPLIYRASDPSNALIWNVADTTVALYYFQSGPQPTLVVTYKDCLDCRIQGGTTTKPPFWQ